MSLKKGKKDYVSIIVFFFICGGLLIACSDVDEYEIVIPKGHATYMISRQGELDVTSRFDTVFVFGHNDNKLIAEEITDYLNKQEPGSPFQYRRFYPYEDIKGS